jgi:signal transduction histidine kinase
VPASIPCVRGNATLFEQVLLNLVSNARDATPAGGTIRVAAAAAGPRVEIAIEDTGSGMDEAALERVREPFFTTKPDGSGLGLAICRAIVTEMGGDLSIASRANAGTRVVVSLPAAVEAVAGAPRGRTSS